MGLGGGSIVKLASNENPLGMSPKAKQAAVGGARRRRALSGRQRLRAEAGAGRALRRGAWTRSCSATAPTTCSTWPRASFSRRAARRSIAQHAFAVYPLATQATGADGHRGAGAATTATTCRHAGGDDAAIRAWSSSPIRTTRPAPSCPTASCAHSCSTNCRRDVAGGAGRGLQRVPAAGRARSTRSPGSSAIPNLSSPAPSPRSTAWPACASASPWRSAEVADLMNRVRQPFNVNNLALAAADGGAGRPRVRRPQLRRSTAAAWSRSSPGLQASGPGAHSVLRQLRHLPRRRWRARSIDSLLQQGVIVRPDRRLRHAQHLRVTIGLEPENARFLEALEQALEQALAD